MHNATTKLIYKRRWLFYRDSGFTLIEAVAGILILVIMLGTFIVAFQQTVDAAAMASLRERATEVAQRHLEMLLANPQEPNSIGLPSIDEIDPLFVWQMNLKRITIGTRGTYQNLSNTVIEATVSAQCASDENRSIQPVKLTRYFATMKPKPGNTIAVPLTPDQENIWYIELKQKLGREPTLKESLEYMLQLEGLPAEWAEEIELPEADENITEETIEELEQEIIDRKETEAIK
jgi:type II secretory pathway pseudopilin PulG